MGTKLQMFKEKNTDVYRMKLKDYLRKVYYLYLHDYIYSLAYYLKSLWDDFIDLVKEFKKPQTWSSLFFVVSFIAIATKKYTLFKFALPLFIIFGILKHRVRRDYKKNLIKNALLKNNDVILKKEYESYERKCYHSRKKPLDFQTWKMVEFGKVKKNNN